MGYFGVIMVKTVRQSNNQSISPRIAKQISDAQAANLSRDRFYAYCHRKRLKRIFLIGTAIILVLLFKLFGSIVSYHNTRTQLTVVTKKANESQEKVDGLKKQVKKLKDPEFLEQLLRDKYDYSKEGEIIYNLPVQGD